MDVGVGSVMFSAGLTQRKIRDLVLLPPDKRKKSNICKDLLSLFYASFFIFLLAFGRFLLHRKLDYHVSLKRLNSLQGHVTEYGVHWNFYATVYVVNVVLVIIQDYFQYSLPFSLAIMIVYEFTLLTLGLKQFVFYGPRNDFLSANREGVASSFGYLAITLIGIEIGRKIF